MGSRRVGGVDPLTGASYAKTGGGSINTIFGQPELLRTPQKLTDTTLHLPLLHDALDFFRRLLVS